MTMRAMTASARAICYQTAKAIDLQNASPDEDVRKKNTDLAGLLTPVAKAFSTDIGMEVASLGVQVHGGMGFIEETGAAQHYRDARIAPIYEGTNGIQAIDLVMRKLGLNNGETVQALLDELTQTAQEISASNAPEFGNTGECLLTAVKNLQETTHWMQEKTTSELDQALAGATPYLRLFGLTAGAGFLARGVLQSRQKNGANSTKNLALLRFLAEHHLPETQSLATSIMTSGAALLDISDDQFQQ